MTLRLSSAGNSASQTVDWRRVSFDSGAVFFMTSRVRRSAQILLQGSGVILISVSRVLRLSASDHLRHADHHGASQITMSGKFLPYKYYGNEQGIPEYGYKETT